MDALETPATTPLVSSADIKTNDTGGSYMVRKPQMIGTIAATGTLFGLIAKYGLKQSDVWSAGAAVLGCLGGWFIDAAIQSKMYGTKIGS